MFIKMSSKKAQSTLEYAILIGVIVGGLIAMQVYLKRGFAGKMKESADSMGGQFNPLLTTAHSSTKSVSNTEEIVQSKVTTSKINDMATNREGNESIDQLNKEEWWK